MGAHVVVEPELTKCGGKYCEPADFDQMTKEEIIEWFDTTEEPLRAARDDGAVHRAGRRPWAGRVSVAADRSGSASPY
jgi:hypothetical protein